MQWKQIFSYLCYPTGDRQEKKKNLQQLSCCGYYRIVAVCQLAIYHIKKLTELA